MATAMAGATMIIANGKNTAAVKMRRRSIGQTFNAGGDSSMIGSSVQAGVDQIEERLARATSAPTIGSSSGPQNAAAINRRSLSDGHTISRKSWGYGD